MASAIPGELRLSPATTERLHTLVVELKRWNPAVNLVARSTLADAWTRHVLDSIQLLDHAPATARVWGDLGSGGGFPGLAVAITAAETHPDLRVVLIESDQRKAVFLRETARMLGVAVAVHGRRVEDVPPLCADVVSARALAPLPALWSLAYRHLAPGGVGLFLKGKGHMAELEQARAQAPIVAEVFSSRTSADGAIVRMRLRD